METEYCNYNRKYVSKNEALSLLGKHMILGSNNELFEIRVERLMYGGLTQTGIFYLMAGRALTEQQVELILQSEDVRMCDNLGPKRKICFLLKKGNEMYVKRVWGNDSDTCELGEYVFVNGIDDYRFVVLQ